jgi:transposase-like protein
MSSNKTLRSPGISNFTGEDVPGFRQREGASAMKLQNKRKLAAAVALTALTTPLAAARADDIAAEIRELKEQVKQLEPLKARLKQLEAEVAKDRRERKEAQSRVRNATARPEHPEGESQNPISSTAVAPVGPVGPEMPFYRITANSSVR